MFAKPSTRTTVHFAATAGLAVTMLAMTGCTAQSAAKPAATTGTTDSGSTSTTPTAAQTAPSLPKAPPQSWLAPAQVPFDSTERWTGGTASSAQSGTTVLNSTSIVYPCMDHGYQAVAHDASGFKTNVFTGSGAPGFDTSATATQSYLTYASATAAQSAFQAMKQDLTGCTAHGVGDISANTHRPMTTTETVTARTTDSVAYTYILRDDQGRRAQVNGNYSGAADYHAYVAINGATIEILWLAGGSDIDGTSNDAAILRTVAGTLI